MTRRSTAATIVGGILCFLAVRYGIAFARGFIDGFIQGFVAEGGTASGATVALLVIAAFLVWLGFGLWCVWRGSPWWAYADGLLQWTAIVAVAIVAGLLFMGQDAQIVALEQRVGSIEAALAGFD
jgi:hypothetical protein